MRSSLNGPPSAAAAGSAPTRIAVTRPSVPQRVAQLARWREVFVLVGDAHELDAVTRCERGDYRVDQLLGARLRRR